MVKCHITYKGGLRCQLEHEPSAAQVITDAPVDNCGQGASFSPTDLMCTAVGACMSTIMGIYAQNNNLSLDGLKVETQKHMGTDPRRIVQIDITIHVPVAKDSPHCQALIACALGSPAMMSLHPSIEVPITWLWEG